MAIDDVLMSFYTSYLAINPVVGCTNGCTYCILERDVGVADKLVQKATADFTLKRIKADKRVAKHNPLALYNISDPFLKPNIPNLLFILEKLEEENYTNPVILITKLNPDKVEPKLEVLKRISRLKKLKPVLMVSYANLPQQVEPASKPARLELMAKAKELGIPVVHYARPLWEEWTPLSKAAEMVNETANIADAVVLGGVIMYDKIKERLTQRKVPVPPWGNEKGRYMDGKYRIAITNMYWHKNPNLGVFINSSCGISHALKRANYMGYYWHFSHFDAEGYCRKPCHAKQRERCANAVPSIKKVADPAKAAVENAKVIEWLRSFKLPPQFPPPEKIDFLIENGYVRVHNAQLTIQQRRMMGQHTGVFVYHQDNFNRIDGKYIFR